MLHSLVLGVNGQDGSYLAEALLARGHQVVGVGRDPFSRYLTPSKHYHYTQLDVSDTDALAALLRSRALDQAFHFAVLHGASDFSYEPVWDQMLKTNVASLHTLLEHARTAAPDLRVVYAGSRKIFPEPLQGVIDEATPVQATCLYSIGKVAARNLIQHYVQHHGVRATNITLFHHESPRRQPQYLFPTIVRGILAAKQDPGHRTKVRTLDFWIDWGAAEEFMDIVADIAEQTDEPELVLASGRTWYARTAAERLFQQHGLDAMQHLEEARATCSPSGSFEVRLDRLERAIGRTPQKQIEEIADSMILAAERKVFDKQRGAHD
jgi:GDPmannose 4,6-dehydratase